MTSALDELGELMADRGRQNYGERVTIAEHSLLTAVAAQSDGAHDTLVAACLMHDVGHFLAEPDDAYGLHNHGDLGADWVADRFSAAVAEPVRLHVEAKRYLCAVEPEYHDQLSVSSQYTLTKQGGPMSSAEAAEFAAEPYFDDAVQLRRYEDDLGKRDNIEVVDLAHFADLLGRL